MLTKIFYRIYKKLYLLPLLLIAMLAVLILKVAELPFEKTVSAINSKNINNIEDTQNKKEKSIKKTQLTTQNDDIQKQKAEELLNQKKHQQEVEAFDPLDLSNTEIDVLQNLRERRLEIEKRLRDIEAREKQLKIVENRVDEKIKKLRKLETTVNSLLSKYDDDLVV